MKFTLILSFPLASFGEFGYNKAVSRVEGTVKVLARTFRARYRRRWKYALLPCTLLCFMYGLWGAMEIFTGNASNFRFTYFEALAPLLGVTLCGSLLLCALVSLLPRRHFTRALALILALSICSYVQNLFLNLNLGLLDGEKVDWSQYTAHGWRNLALWAGMLAAITCGLLLFKKRARRVIRAVSAVLLAVQVISFGVVSAQHLTSDAHSARDTTYVLTGDQQYQVSAEGNVIMFLLDYYSNDYIDAALKQYPDMLEPLRDFTYYDNYDPAYIGTFPSVVHMLTGNEFDTTVPIDDWFRQSWGSATAQSFYEKLFAAGYKFNFFDSSNDYFGIQYAQPYVSNLRMLTRSDYTVRYDRLTAVMLKLSAYRYFPHVLKRYVEPDSFAFYQAVPLDGGEVNTCENRNAFYNYLYQQGLRPVSGDGKYFIIEFLKGTHPPYHLSAEAEYDPNATLEETAAGYMKIVATYLQKLKDLGLYDDATIIVTSDHGDKENSMQIMYFIKEPGVHREEMAVSSAPVSHCELLGTILKNIGVESEFPSIYDFADGEKRERTVMRNYIDPAYPAVPKYHSTAVGTHTVMYAYTYTGNRLDLRKQFRRGPTQILPLTESFN